MASPIRYQYQSLEDFVISTTLTIDAQFDDGWNALFPVKGREIEATVLFADITSFTARTVDLTPEETLFFVNNFFAWVTAEALRGRPGIVDKYIGDALMIVFSKEFGSDDPFIDAVQAARWMSENDAHSFSPHIGLASGKVIVGYVGTQLKYNCSVFGRPVALAARCASEGPADGAGAFSTAIVFPADEWDGRDFDAIFPPKRYRNADGSTFDQPHSWELLEPREVDMKNLGSTAIREIVNRGIHFPTQSAEDRAREGIADYKEARLRAALELADRRARSMTRVAGDTPTPAEQRAWDAKEQRFFRQLGERLREVIQPDGWVSFDVDERRERMHRAHELLRGELQIKRRAPLLLTDDPDNAGAGYDETSEEGDIHYPQHHLETAKPEELVRGLVEEMRHVWQDDIRRGLTEHPLGAVGHLELEHGFATYNTNDPRTDTTNRLELDAKERAEWAVDGYLGNPPEC